jgi:ComF family protein
MQLGAVSRLGRLALDLIYPPRCAVCGTGGVFLCERCSEALPRADGPRCSRCWLPLRGPECFACAQHPPHLERLRSAFRYEAGVIHLVHAFKFGGQSSLAPSLGALLADAYDRHALETGVIVPVPLTGSRRRIRGYNQALLMANELSSRTGVPVAEALRRTGHSTTQAGSASAEERRRNVEGVFSLARGHEVAGARVLLIDDVATTGATLDACASVLLESGARAVSGLTLARED